MLVWNYEPCSKWRTKLAKEEVQIDQDDVKIVRIEPLVCDDCGGKATHRVWLDMRNNGEMTAVSSKVCHTCAKRFASRLKKSLPPMPRKRA